MRPAPTSRTPAILAATLALCAPTFAAADDPPERLEAWPQLEGTTESKALKDIQRVRKARTPEMAEQAHAELVRAGAGVAPLLLPLLGKEREEEARERLRAVLTAVTDAEHTRLLAREFAHSSAEVRTFCLERAGAFPDPGTRAQAEAALARVNEWRERKDRKYTPAEHLAAALAITAAGSTAALDHLLQCAVESWVEHGDSMRSALAGARGEQASRQLCEQLEGASRAGKVAAMRLLSACGTSEEAVPVVRPFLDSSDNSLRIAAINALRGIVDGAPPLKRLSVFDAIERAKRWKTRV